jgi:hypothetical protein
MNHTRQAALGKRYAVELPLRTQIIFHSANNNSSSIPHSQGPRMPSLQKRRRIAGFAPVYPELYPSHDDHIYRTLFITHKLQQFTPR